MLKDAVPDLEEKLRTILHDAAYAASMSMFVSGDSSITNSYATKTTEKQSELFASTFADTAYADMADAIYKFVLELGIVATPSGSLISTSITSPSPVSGSILMSDFTLS